MKKENLKLMEHVVCWLHESEAENQLTQKGTFFMIFLQSRVSTFMMAHNPLTAEDVYRGKFMGDDAAQFYFNACIVPSRAKGEFQVLLHYENKTTGEQGCYRIGCPEDPEDVKVFCWVILGDAAKGKSQLRSFNLIEDAPGGAVCSYCEYLTRKRKGRFAFMLSLVQHFANISLDTQKLLTIGRGEDDE